MTFISRAARYVLRKRVRTAVLFIVLRSEEHTSELQSQR